MKKITLAFIVLCFLTNNVSFAQLGGTASGAFGNKSCTGFGFNCGGGGIQSQQKEGFTNLTLSYTVETQTLSINIKTADVSKSNPEAWEYLKTHSSFSTQENTTIERSVLQKLNLPENTVIPPGTYKINKTESGFEIDIPIKE